MPQGLDMSHPTQQNFEYCRSKRCTTQHITSWHADFSLPSHLLRRNECRRLQHNWVHRGFGVKIPKNAFPKPTQLFIFTPTFTDASNLSVSLCLPSNLETSTIVTDVVLD
jgi:hypothetical protein